ncbi:MAG: hypothetical protein N3J91_10000 [Verrucomicrobiae bacterium]|nr:hypothetical protein [Verrucomicrobiae bacterium]
MPRSEGKKTIAHRMAKTRLTHGKAGLALIIAAAGLACLQGQTFTVTGTLVQHSYIPSTGDPGGKLVEVQNYTFVMHRHKCTWRIETKVKDQSPGFDHIIEYEVQHDGTNIYEIRKTNPDLIQPERQAKEARAKKVNCFAEVYASLVPRGNATRANIIYLAYGATCYLNSSGRGRIKPFGLLDDRLFTNAHYQVGAEWEFNTGYPGLLKSLKWYSDGTYYVLSSNKQLQQRRHPPPYHNGFLQGEYEVIRTTNVSGMHMPIVFALNIYTPAVSGKGSNELYMVVRYYGQAQSIHVEAPDTAANILKSPGDVLVYDKRFSKISRPIVYHASTNWPFGNTQLIRELYQLQMQLDAKNEAPPRQARVIAALLLVLLLFWPLVFCWRKAGTRH